MSKKVPLYLCDKKREECNGPCYRECRLTHDIDHAVRNDEGNPIIITYTYFEDPGLDEAEDAEFREIVALREQKIQTI